MKYFIYILSMFGVNLFESAMRGRYLYEKQRIKKIIKHVNIAYIMLYINTITNLVILVNVIPEKTIRLDSATGLIGIIALAFMIIVTKPMMVLFGKQKIVKKKETTKIKDIIKNLQGWDI